jgi:transcriptional regulator with XRE-family HTH domain
MASANRPWGACAQVEGNLSALPWLILFCTSCTAIHVRDLVLNDSIVHVLSRAVKSARRIFRCVDFRASVRAFWQALGERLKAAREAAGLTLKDVALLTGQFLTARKLAQFENDSRLSSMAAHSLASRVDQYVAMFAQLYGVPLETLLYNDAELTILRRRVERLRRRFGLPGPRGNTQADAA